MKSTQVVVARVVFASFILLIASCHKFDLDDFIHPDNTPEVCQIKKFTSDSEVEGLMRTWLFSYNQKGDPTWVKQDSLFNGRPDLLFLYDNRKRLTDFVTPYQNNHFEQWHHYAYEGNRIVRDTARAFGIMVNGKPVEDPFYAALTTIHHFEYDSYNRISKWSFQFATNPQPLTRVRTYEYNNKGNLYHYKDEVPEVNAILVDTFYTNYDNKANIHRSNKIWMFIDKDYSVNNREAALEYNSYGFPVKYNTQKLEPFLGAMSFGNAKIKYECR